MPTERVECLGYGALCGPFLVVLLLAVIEVGYRLFVKLAQLLARRRTP